jgi:DNA-binding NarL/FixJ family response regulator
MLRDIITDAFADQPDILLVAQAAAGDEMESAIERGRADVVITGLDVGGNRQFCEPVFRRHPRLTVISIPADGSGAYAWTLRLHGERLGDVSPDGLIEAIRQAVGQPVEEM